MKKPSPKLARALLEACAIRIRHKNHDIWQLPNGRRFVVGTSPSCARAEQNALAMLKRLTRSTP